MSSFHTLVYHLTFLIEVIVKNNLAKAHSELLPDSDSCHKLELCYGKKEYYHHCAYTGQVGL